MKNKMLHSSREMIQIRAKAIFDEETDDPLVKETFFASSGWIQNFMKTSSLMQVNIYSINLGLLRKFALVHLIFFVD